jgi:hypothetical protein
VVDAGEVVRGPFVLPEKATFTNAGTNPVAGDSLVYRQDGTLLAGGALVVHAAPPSTKTKTLTVMRSTGEVWVQ